MQRWIGQTETGREQSHESRGRGGRLRDRQQHEPGGERHDAGEQHPLLAETPGHWPDQAALDHHDHHADAGEHVTDIARAPGQLPLGP